MQQEQKREKLSDATRAMVQSSHQTWEKVISERQRKEENKIVFLKDKSSTDLPCTWMSCPNIYDIAALYQCSNSLLKAPYTCKPPTLATFMHMLILLYLKA